MRPALAALALLACSNTTGGDLLTLPLEAGGVDRDATQPFIFTNLKGWTVTLDQAFIAVGPFYFNVSAPSTASFRSGVVIVEATEQTIVDVLDPTLHVVGGGADGETGHALSVEIGLLPVDMANQSAAPQAAAQLGSGFAFVSGTALRGTTSVPFQGPIVVNASLVTATAPLADLERVRGASVDLAFTAAPATLELRIDPTHWFDQVDFTELATTASPPPGGYTWTTTSTFASQLLQGVKSESDVYSFGLVPSAP